MRDIVKVIERVLPLVSRRPGDHYSPNTLFITRLKDVQARARYFAPEMQQGLWMEGTQAFYQRFGEKGPIEEWEIEAVAIWRGERES